MDVTCQDDEWGGVEKTERVATQKKKKKTKTLQQQEGVDVVQTSQI